MKTSILKTLFVTLALLLTTQAHAQMINTRIDVQGSRYSDVMWLFSVNSCTRGFDNGWDGYKMFGSSPLIPQLFAWEAVGNFQIDCIPTYDNTYIGFKAGEDTVYTLTFTHQLIETVYTSLYLIDSVANKTVDILANGSKYTFTVQPTTVPVKRFKIVTTNPNAPIVVVTPPIVPVDTVVTTPPTTPPVVTPVDTVIVAPVDTIVSPTNPVVPPVNPKDKKDKKIKIHSCKKDLVIDNGCKQKGKVKIYNARTGKMVKNYDVNANGTTTISTNLPTGTYIVNGSADIESVTVNIVVY